MTANKEPKRHFFAFPQNWDALTEKEQEEWVNQLYDRMMEKFKEHDK